MCHVRRSLNFFSNDSKDYAATKAEHSERIIELLQNRTVLFAGVITIWNNADSCAEQYFYMNRLYLLSMLEHAYNIIFDRDVGAPGHGREVVDGLTDTKNVFSSVDDKCETA